MGTRLEDLKSRLVIGSGGVRMIGIWGIGGGGKTTLASSLYIEIRSKFDSCCFVENIKEESKVKTLQEKILSTVLKKELKVESIDIGKNTIKGMLRSRNVLIVLDDVDDLKQLEALAGSHDWFGDGSRIIITTRDEHLLRSHKVDEIYEISLLSHDEAIKLFNKHAYKETSPVEDYEMLSLRVVSYASGLPLALKVLGSFLCDKDKGEWISSLKRLKDIPEMEIVKILKISYDGLTTPEKELFLDIACLFCRGMKKDTAMEMLDACGYHPGIGVKVLMQKGLITINSNGKFDMHDLVQEMGHYIVRGEHPNNPEKHSRLWLKEEIDEMCYGNERTENNSTEAILSYNCPLGFDKFLLKAKTLRLLYVFNQLGKGHIEVPRYLSNELCYLYWKIYPAGPFPESFEPRKLVFLRIEESLQEELWRNYKFLPCLKELHLYCAYNLARTPDLGGLPCLEKLTLEKCDRLKEIHPSLGNHSSLVYVYVKNCKELEVFPAIVNMGKLKILDISNCNALSKFPTIAQMGKLEIFQITNCKALHKFPEIEANMGSLINLSLEVVGIEALPSSVGEYCTKLKSLQLKRCFELGRIEGNFHALKDLQICEISNGLGSRIVMPKDLFHEHIDLKELHLEYTRQPSIPHLPCFLTRLTLKYCKLKDGEIPCDIGELYNLQELDLSRNLFTRLNFSILQLTRLKLLSLEGCWYLVELPELPTNIAILETDYCESLELIGDIMRNCYGKSHLGMGERQLMMVTDYCETCFREMQLKMVVCIYTSKALRFQMDLYLVCVEGGDVDWNYQRIGTMTFLDSYSVLLC